MTNLFSVIGEHRDDPDRLLLLGEDGHLYDLPSPEREPTPTEPTDEWNVDPDVSRELPAADPHGRDRD